MDDSGDDLILLSDNNNTVSASPARENAHVLVKDETAKDPAQEEQRNASAKRKARDELHKKKKEDDERLAKRRAQIEEIESKRKKKEEEKAEMKRKREQEQELKRLKKEEEQRKKEAEQELKRLKMEQKFLEEEAKRKAKEEIQLKEKRKIEKSATFMSQFFSKAAKPAASAFPPKIVPLVKDENKNSIPLSDSREDEPKSRPQVPDIPKELAPENLSAVHGCTVSSSSGDRQEGGARTCNLNGIPDRDGSVSVTISRQNMEQPLLSLVLDLSLSADELRSMHFLRWKKTRRKKRRRIEANGVPSSTPQSSFCWDYRRLPKAAPHPFGFKRISVDNTVHSRNASKPVKKRSEPVLPKSANLQTGFAETEPNRLGSDLKAAIVDLTGLAGSDVPAVIDLTEAACSRIPVIGLIEKQNVLSRSGATDLSDVTGVVDLTGNSVVEVSVQPIVEISGTENVLPSEEFGTNSNHGHTNVRSGQECPREIGARGVSEVRAGEVSGEKETLREKAEEERRDSDVELLLIAEREEISMKDRRDVGGKEKERERAREKSRKRKLLQFHGRNRPPYYGAYSKFSLSISGRRPFRKDMTLDYAVDSDEEWEEEEPGENLSDFDDEEEEEEGGERRGEERDEESDSGFLVPDGYLSEDEGVNSTLSSSNDEAPATDGPFPSSRSLSLNSAQHGSDLPQLPSAQTAPILSFSVPNKYATLVEDAIERALKRNKPFCWTIYASTEREREREEEKGGVREGKRNSSGAEEEFQQEVTYEKEKEGEKEGDGEREGKREVEGKRGGEREKEEDSSQVVGTSNVAETVSCVQSSDVARHSMNCSETEANHCTLYNNSSAAAAPLGSDVIKQEKHHENDKEEQIDDGRLGGEEMQVGESEGRSKMENEKTGSQEDIHSVNSDATEVKSPIVSLLKPPEIANNRTSTRGTVPRTDADKKQAFVVYECLKAFSIERLSEGQIEPPPSNTSLNSETSDTRKRRKKKEREGVEEGERKRGRKGGREEEASIIGPPPIHVIRRRKRSETERRLGNYAHCSWREEEPLPPPLSPAPPHTPALPFPSVPNSLPLANPLSPARIATHVSTPVCAAPSTLCLASEITELMKMGVTEETVGLLDTNEDGSKCANTVTGKKEIKCGSHQELLELTREEQQIVTSFVGIVEPGRAQMEPGLQAPEGDVTCRSNS